MRIVELRKDPMEELICLSASVRGPPETLRLPILRGSVEGLRSEIAAVVVASDLQAVAPVRAAEGASGPAGGALVELLVDLEAAGTIPSLDTIGVVLAGDLYSDPSANKRGATGDVRDVWRAFAQHFRWVAGVGGNHDAFGKTPRDRERFGREPGIHLLDGNVAELDGIRIGGVSGIIGPPGKPTRRDTGTMMALLHEVIALAPDVLVLHEGPDCGRGYPGNIDLARVLSDCHDTLVVCGHVHWPDALQTVQGGPQVVNVTERILLLANDG